MSKPIKVLSFVLLIVLGAAIGIYFEFYHSEDFDIAPIPTSSQTTQIKNTAVSPYDDMGRLDINMASRDELIKLKGIGEKTADKIIKFREENGDFQAVEELVHINGISINTVKELEGKICVR